MRIPGGCDRCYLPIGSSAWEAKYRADLDSIVAEANRRFAFKRGVGPRRGTGAL
jgi:hypothetical protein